MANGDLKKYNSTTQQWERVTAGAISDGTTTITPSKLIQQPIYLGSGTNLNSVTTPGMYYNQADSETSTMLNAPSTHAFSLLVEKHAGVKQTFTEYLQNGLANMWFRNFYSNTWSNWHRIWADNIDGAGSGLDADLLDGIQSSQIVYGDATNATNSVSDFNSINKSGFYRGNNAANAPTASDWNYVIHVAHDTSWSRQIGGSYYDEIQYVRVKQNGTWGAWKPVGGVKSVQRGVTAVNSAGGTVDVTIGSVNMNKASVVLQTIYAINGTSGTNCQIRASLTSSTNLEFISVGGYSVIVNVAWEVIESY